MNHSRVVKFIPLMPVPILGPTRYVQMTMDSQAISSQSQYCTLETKLMKRNSRRSSGIPSLCFNWRLWAIRNHDVILRLWLEKRLPASDPSPLCFDLWRVDQNVQPKWGANSIQLHMKLRTHMKWRPRPPNLTPRKTRP
jgi:hypothetical protein